MSADFRRLIDGNEGGEKRAGVLGCGGLLPMFGLLQNRPPRLQNKPERFFWYYNMDMLKYLGTTNET